WRAFLSGSLQKAAFSRGVICRKLVGPGKCGNGVYVVMPLSVDICPGKLVVIALLVVGGVSQRSQLLFRFAVIALCDVSIGQADGYRVVRSAQIFCLGEIA